VRRWPYRQFLEAVAFVEETIRIQEKNSRG
jgi:hypothetical protein